VTGPGSNGGRPPTEPGGGPGEPGTGSGAIVGPASQAPRIAFDEESLDLGTVGVDLIGGIEVWTVPAATLALPGLLLLIWVALQTLGALAWIPAVRRMRDAEDAPG
jgi:hypothetical protein